MSEVIPFPRRDVVIAFPRSGTRLMARDRAILQRLEDIHDAIDRVSGELGKRETDDLFSLSLMAGLLVDELATDLMRGKL